MKRVFLTLFVIFIGLVFTVNNHACTNFIVTKGASKDGSVFITYSADSYGMYGELQHFKATIYPNGMILDIYDGDTGVFLGSIPQAEVTYNVVGNINEYQVAIGETTFGGRNELRSEEGLLDYNNLMWIALQRAKTAREAIKVMTDLANEYGYHSSGESFSIADPNEAWIMEWVGKGKEKGVVWVARRIPDGYVCAHANMARITTFPLDDPDNCLYAPDIISFAREKGYFNGEDEDFSFADAYDPMSFGAIRFCDARVWSFFRKVKDGMDKHLPYILGETTERMPLWIKPDKKLSLHDVMLCMRDHYEGTPLDMSKGIASGPYNSPYRATPLVWKAGDDFYFNERPVSTVQTPFSFVAQMRSHLPREIGGIIWFGFDDTYMTVYTPMYCSITEIPYNYREGVGSERVFNWDAGFWMFNAVSQFVYPRYSLVIDKLKDTQNRLEGGYITNQPVIEKKAAELYKSSPREAVDYLTQYSASAGNNTYTTWKGLHEYLIQHYSDFIEKDDNFKLNRIGYSEEIRKQMAEETGDFLKMKQVMTDGERNIQFNLAVERGDNALAAKDYDGAKEAYEAALELKVNAEYPKSQIEKINKFLESLEDLHTTQFSN
ncbi:dipeptidase [Bacteroidota bacterium]